MLSCEEVEFEGAGGARIAGFLAVPAVAAAAESPASPGELRGGLVLIHEVFGLDAHMREVARRLAAQGYAVIAPDLYSRDGLPGPAATVAGGAPSWDAETVRGAVASLPDRRVLGDLDAALALLVERTGLADDKLGALGFCMGGNYAYLFGCHSDRVHAVVDFYGRIVYPELSANKPMQPLEMALNLTAPLLALFAGQDPSIPAEDVAALERQLGQFMKRAEVHVFAGAQHGFFNETRPGYDAQAAERAWQLVLEFLAEEWDED